MYKFSILFFLLLGFTLSQAQTVTDAAGKKQGYWKKKDEKTNKLIYEGLFKDNIPQGKFKYYSPNDSVKAIMVFKNDGKVAYSIMYHPTGKKMAIGKYIGEDKDSLWTYFDEKGILISTENFTSGKKNGKTTVYLPDGMISEERYYKMGLQNGQFKQYFDKTHVKGEGTYVNDQLEGKNAYYFPNGVEAAVGYYKNGQKNGPWIYKESNGKIKEKELYKNGQLADKKETEAFFTKNKPLETPVKADEKKSTTSPKSTTKKTTVK